MLYCHCRTINIFSKVYRVTVRVVLILILSISRTPAMARICYVAR
jgi:hypothetical protein